MRLVLPTPTGLAYEWYALAASSMQQQRTSAFRGGRGVLGGGMQRGIVGIRNWAQGLVGIWNSGGGID